MGTWKVMRKNSKVEPQLTINFVGGASDNAYTSSEDFH